MPIYEYACSSCEHRFETIQRVSEGALRECPACGEAALKKLLSAPNFHLKGSGWYETDFKNADKRKEAASGEAAAEGNGKSADGADGASADKSSENPAAEKSGAEKSGAEKSNDGGGKQAAGKAEGAGAKADSGAKSTGSSAPKTKD